ncbi:prepilin-type N-terminal cleavage/methylation domain-containing protein [candidate division WOR-3 bacterium]|nr:prepilin-type N-terminal cleavage/methylation domain-containing protein [candidate division WOR-3 bacterium]
MIRNKGFTLIELLVVIVVIGVLSGVGIYYFRGLFVRQRLEESKNEVIAFYQRTNRYATTDGEDYKIEVDKQNEFLRCMKASAATVTKDSLGLRQGLDLEHNGGATITFTVNADGTVDDDDNERDFTVTDAEIGKTIEFYISPLGIMEVEVK